MDEGQGQFREGDHFCACSGVALLLVYVPIKYRVYREAIQVPQGSPLENWDVWTALPRKFSELCASASVPCVNLTEALQRAVRQGVTVYPLTDTHWSPEGHALVAAEIERALHNLGWMP